ncbi:DUF3298 and DUF4163 domain-containing protein [Bacillus suaedae]|uniref:DUF3298 and DUF4163 domain-containing protein n=1 Tax=Halalkalibacter suaedae TaxID=2822140 RepID=A0A940WXQ3_9BACI|nr:DUF3298 and DUF4163 domain-containing protein [Bacillus suaedae]MBP3953678.1 DUF3298 and DUF4163 domain-containing protein [Bacillus suaedae]
MTVTLPVRIKTWRVSNGPNQQVLYPMISRMNNPVLERMINRAIVDQTQQLINQQIGNSPSTVVEMLGTYEIKNNQRDVLSLAFTNYTYHHKAAHGMTYIKSLTFDLKQGKLMSLKDLFKPDSDYINRISALIQTQIKERDIPLLEDFTTIQPDQDFYVADKTLVIYFQLYDITPYVYGFPMFPLSLYDLQDIIAENGPLGRLAQNN